MDLESFQFLETDRTLQRKCSDYYWFGLAFFRSIISAYVFLTVKRVKAFFAYVLLSITKPNLFVNDILETTCEIFICESIDACDLLHTSHLHNIFAFRALSKFKHSNKSSFFKLLLLLSGDIGLNPGPSDIDVIIIIISNLFSVDLTITFVSRFTSSASTIII